MTTSSGYSLNSFLILEQDGSPVESGHRSDEIMAALHEGLTQKGQEPLKVSRRMPRQHKHFHAPTKITFSQEPTHQRTAMRLTTLDRPGLLSKVAQAFVTCDIRLQHARIATLGAEVEDIFFITDRDNRPLLEGPQMDCLREAVISRLPE
jgi:[protein-PII] uridylyltransferase